MISAQQIKILREKTGAGIFDIKKALEDCGGDSEKAEEIIEERLGNAAGKRSGRKTMEGIVDAYIHSNGRIGVLVELFCETDFVARNPAFKSLAHDIAMHIAALQPLYLSLATVPKEIWRREEEKILEEARAMSKPAHLITEIVEGKLKSHFGDISLLSQPFVKDQDKTVKEHLDEAIGRFGENIQIGRFIRFEI